MKKLGMNALMKNILFAVISTVMIFSFNSCVTKANFLASTVVPGAGGTVKVKTDKNKNYVISVDVYNLAQVSMLNPARQTYVVWMDTEDNMTKNLGKINSSTSIFSKQFKASFQTVSSFKPAKIYITAEDEANILQPGTQLILSTDVFSIRK
jgi:hypothetical protein